MSDEEGRRFPDDDSRKIEAEVRRRRVESQRRLAELCEQIDEEIWGHKDNTG
jgi:hypothetical protein